VNTRRSCAAFFSFLTLASLAVAQARPKLPTPTGWLDEAWAVDVLPDGKGAVFLGGDGTLRLADLPHCRVRASRNTGMRALGLAIDPQGSVVAAWHGARLRLYSLPHLTRILDTKRPGGWDFVWAGRGEFLRGEMIWSQAELRTYAGTSVLESFFHGAPDGRQAANGVGWGPVHPPVGDVKEATGYTMREGTLRILGLESGSVRRLPFARPFQDGVVHVRYSPDSSLLAATSGVEEFAVWEVSSGRLVAQSPRHSGVMRVAVPVKTPGGPVLLAPSGGSVQVKDLTRGASRDLGRLHDGYIDDLRVSSDGRWLVSVGGGVAKVWDLARLLQGGAPALVPAGSDLPATPPPAARPGATGRPFGL
jgi:WD40 repeat protein